MWNRKSDFYVGLDGKVKVIVFLKSQVIIMYCRVKRSWEHISCVSRSVFQNYFQKLRNKARYFAAQIVYMRWFLSAASIEFKGKLTPMKHWLLIPYILKILSIMKIGSACMIKSRLFSAQDEECSLDKRGLGFGRGVPVSIGSGFLCRQGNVGY